MKLAEKILELIERSTMFDQPDFTTKVHPEAANQASLELGDVYSKLVAVQIDLESIIDKPKGYGKAVKRLEILLDHVWKAKQESVLFTKFLSKVKRT